MKKKLLVFFVMLLLIVTAFCGTTVSASATTTSTNAPERPTSDWVFLDSYIEPNNEYKYEVYKSKKQIKQQRVGAYVKALVNVNEAAVDFSYTVTETTKDSTNIDLETTISGEVGFIAKGTFSGSVFSKLSTEVTFTKGTTLSKTLINDTNNPAGIYQLSVYVTKRKYAFDAYKQKLVKKTKVVKVKEGKKTVTKTETFYIPDGWIYCGTYEAYFLDISNGYKCIHTVKVERIADCPTIVD